MLGAVDATKWPPGHPPRFIPYIEKHRIYELFHEIATQLLIKKPINHILYMKQCLSHAIRCRDYPRIILFSPPDFDKVPLAEYLENKLDIKLITLEHLKLSSANSTSADNLANVVRNFLRQLYIDQSGWIFTDFPRDKLEARALQRIGILPTHVIEIVWSDEPNYTYTMDNFGKKDTSVKSFFYDDHKNSQQCDYNLQIHGLRDAYAKLLITVQTAGRNYEQLGNACVTLCKRLRYRVPCNYRILLIGSRGSGRKSVAQYLSKRYGLVHIDYDDTFKETKMQQNSDLCKIHRNIDLQWDRPKSATKIKIIENKLMNSPYIERGWILTGYPITVEDFKLLNLLATPPNRIVFLDVDETTRRERLLSRRFNVLTGSEHHLPLDNNCTETSRPQLTIHPRDYGSQVHRDIREYDENIKKLLRYAGNSVNVVDGMAGKRVVQERVEACLARPVTCAVRVPKLAKKIKPEEIEYEPDEPLDQRIFDSLRAKESLLSLV